jgi:hypothetical protein
MLAYVNLVQRREKELGCDVLTHQTWSGASLVDGMLGAIQSGSTGSKSMGEGNTETSKFVPALSPSPTTNSIKICFEFSRSWMANKNFFNLGF